MTREDLDASLARLRSEIADPRAGILGPDSIAWQLGADLGLFIGGGRAALLQLAHPFVAYAIDQHSRTRSDVTGRFQRTFRNVFAMVFGELDDALAAARRLHTIHARIHGVIPQTVGGWPAGTPYHANDPHALRWVHATLLDTTITMRELLDGPLPTDLKDRYVRELHRFAALFAIPRELLADSWSAHVAYMHAMYDRLAVAPCAREMGRFLLGRDPVDAQPPLGRIAEAVTHALLPPRLAEQFGLRGTPRMTRAGLAAFAQLYRRLPRRAIAIPACSEARRRLSGRAPSRLAAWTERQLFGLARRTTTARTTSPTTPATRTSTKNPA